VLRPLVVSVCYASEQPGRRTATREVLTIEEIRTRFDSAWVLVEDPEVNEHKEVLGGKVVCHSKNRDEVYRKAVKLRLKHSAFLYTGRVPEDAVIVL